MILCRHFIKERCQLRRCLIQNQMIPLFRTKLRFHEDPFQGKAKNIAWTPKLEMENEAFQISEVLLYRNQQNIKLCTECIANI